MRFVRAVLILLLLPWGLLAGPAEMPVNVGALEGPEAGAVTEVKHFRIRNLFAVPDLLSAIGGGEKGLALDLSRVSTLLDGTEVDPAKVHGTAWFGPYPFEAEETRFDHKRFRIGVAIQGGKAVLPVGALLRPKYDSEGWGGEGAGRVAVRLELVLEQKGRDRPLGTYDVFASFKKAGGAFVKLPGIVEGPFVSFFSAGDDPRHAVISFVTDAPAVPVIEIDGAEARRGAAGRRHEITLRGLEPDREYRYRVRCIGPDKENPTATGEHRFRTPPEPGKAPDRLVFAYCGDSREGGGGGLSAYMGVNLSTMERHAALAYRLGARFLLMGGDLVNGYTSSPADFEGQVYAWKQAVSGFWRERAVYPTMGNHEALLKVFDTGLASPLMLDRWPYATESAEAVFARNFVNPRNGPAAEAGRPPYAESVYSFRHGRVMVIAFNNNYWYSGYSRGRGKGAGLFGGCPEGYILPDQMRWIEAELRAAQEDDRVDHVILFAQEPVFPCGGHIGDAMWFHGDNEVRAHTFRDGKLVPEEHGIVEVRNRLARAVGAADKVVAVLGADEHAYYRLLVDRDVPVGPPAGGARSKEGLSYERAPRLDLGHPVWYVTCGGGGAPYYAEESAPWVDYWRGRYSKKPEGDGFYYSSQENVLIFEVEGEKVFLTAMNRFGEVVAGEKRFELTAATRVGK